MRKDQMSFSPRKISKGMRKRTQLEDVADMKLRERLANALRLYVIENHKRTQVVLCLEQRPSAIFVPLQAMYTRKIISSRSVFSSLNPRRFTSRIYTRMR